jgi:heme/copper-type cytochrome/quinol oxidase subunit 3
VVCHHRRVTEGVTLEAPTRRPSPLAVGTVVWLASELMFFGGLFAAYFTLRANATVWPPRGAHLETASALIGTIVLILVALLDHFGLAEIEVSERDILDGIALAAAELPAPAEGAAPPGAYTCC